MSEPNGATIDDRSWAFGYENGELIRITDPTAGMVGRENCIGHDPDGRISTLSDLTGGGCADPQTYTYTYALNDRIETVTEPDVDDANWFLYSYPSSYDASVTLSRKMDVIAPPTGTYDPWQRVWHSGAVGAEEEWEGHHLYDGANWVAYRIRGASLIDGYGNEILYYLDRKMNPHFVSAGPDGAFTLQPGPDGVVSTDAATYRLRTAGTTSGDDIDSSQDNIGVEE